MTLDKVWAETVAKVLEPVFASASVGFVCSQVNDLAMLWEADPALFAERYPDSEIIASYGEQQWSSVHCIDFWFYLDRGAENEVLVSFEGWDAPYRLVEVTGSAAIDGDMLAGMLATHLRLNSPGSPESPGARD